MPTNPIQVAHYIGRRPPANPGPRTLWTSQSMRHFQVPTQPTARTPIIGSEIGDSAAQEFSPWYNSGLKRWEAIVNIGSQQRFTWSYAPGGPWAVPVAVLGNGVGGEAAAARQCSVHVEDGVLYAFYNNTNGTNLQMASAPMPTAGASTPVFTKQGTVATSDIAYNGSPWVMFTRGRYYLFWERGTAMTLSLSSAAKMADLVTTPFVERERLTLPAFYTGYRSIGVNGCNRPSVFYEDGTWVMLFGGGGLQMSYGALHRAICTDPGDIPINWTVSADDTFVMKAVHPLEIDQCVDFRVCADDNETLWIFNSAADNRGSFRFTILATPCILPTFKHNGGGWSPIDTIPRVDDEPRWISPDLITGTTTIKNRWDGLVDTGTAAVALTLTNAASGAAIRLRNTPSTGQGNQMTVALFAGDVLRGGNPITAITASGTTVTVTTKRPHGLTTTDLVTITGAAPSTYNIANTAVTGLPAANQFTYTAGSSPAANTTLGHFARTSFEPGEQVRFDGAPKNTGDWFMTIGSR
jgi:hypothetical protein